MTDLPPTNWRALCAELHAVFNTYAVCQEHHQLLVHTAAALAQPEPQGPTDEEAVVLYSEVMAFYECQTLGDMAGHFARAVLARYARPAIEPQGPTDEDLIELFNENDWNYISLETFLDVARSVLELR